MQLRYIAVRLEAGQLGIIDWAGDKVSEQLSDDFLNAYKRYRRSRDSRRIRHDAHRLYAVYLKTYENRRPLGEELEPLNR